MRYFLAIDAGGTKTDYLLADETTELARVRSGTIKRMRIDAKTAAANLDKALAELTALSGVPLQSIHCTCIGTAGNTVPLVTDWLREAFATRVAGTLVLLGDVEIALDAAFMGRPGVLAIAGTGSNVAGRDETGTLHGAGGWGPALADEGSGHRIGHDALRAVFRAIDRGQTTALLYAILEAWKLTTSDEIVAMANEIPAPDFSRLTEIVLRCAEQGDALATEVLKQQGEELAEVVAIVMRKVRISAGDADWVPTVAFTGSIMEKVLPVRHALIAALEREFPGVRTLAGTVDPIMGALWRARGGR